MTTLRVALIPLRTWPPEDFTIKVPQAIGYSVSSTNGSLMRESVVRPWRAASLSRRRNTCAVRKASPLAVWRSCGITLEHVAQRVQRELANRRTAGECAVSFEVQREIHRVEASIHRAKAPSALVAGVERADVVTDMVSDDHAVPQVVEKARQRLLFLQPAASLVARDAVHRHGARVLSDCQQRVEGVLQHGSRERRRRRLRS